METWGFHIHPITKTHTQQEHGYVFSYFSCILGMSVF